MAGDDLVAGRSRRDGGFGFQLEPVHAGGEIDLEPRAFGHVLAARDHDVVAHDDRIGFDVEVCPIAGGALPVLGDDQYFLPRLHAGKLGRCLAGRVIAAARQSPNPDWPV